MKENKKERLPHYFFTPLSGSVAMRLGMLNMKAWESYIRKVDPYVPGEQPKEKNIIKLNTNENPYPPTKRVLDAIHNLNYDSLKRYPDPRCLELVEAIASYHKLTSDMVFVGVGSDDVLGMAFLTFFNSNKPILFADITYSFYEVWANLFQVPYEKQPLNEELLIRKEDYYKENGGIVIANPNAPTSIYESLDSIRDILEHNQDSIVIVDEAYIDFGGESARDLIKLYDNLLVVQTFSKSRSMAGMRIGYAMGNSRLIKALNDVKFSYNSYTLNQTSIDFGIKAIEDEAYFLECVKKIIDTREYTCKELKKLGFSFPKSSTNFLFVTHPLIHACELYEYLREEHIYVRYFKKPRIDNYLRISIGTMEEMNQFIEVLRKRM